MVSNLVVRNASSGYVSFVAKKRVNGESRTVGYICGLGTMCHADFKKFQKWAHDLKPQEYRKQMVLATDIAVQEKKAGEGKVAAETQKKTTVKRAPKKIVTKAKIRQPVSMKGYKGLSKGMTHTEIMMERIRDEKASKQLKEYKKLQNIKKTPVPSMKKQLTEKEARIAGQLARGEKARKSEASKAWLSDTTARTMTQIYYDMEARDRKKLE